MGIHNWFFLLWNEIPPKPRRKVFSCVILLVWVSSLTWAQQNKACAGSAAQATLQISAYILPAALSLPATTSQSVASTTVAYDIPPEQAQMDVTEERYPLPVGLHGAGSQTTGGGVLETRTIVLQ